MRLLGIDYGTRRVGIAFSDTEQRLAFPYAVFFNDAELIEKIQKLVEEKEFEGIVIGESRNFQQQENKVMVKVREFLEQLKEKIPLSVYFEPEFLTTAEAEHFEKPGMRDASAAAIILQSYLDKNKK